MSTTSSTSGSTGGSSYPYSEYSRVQQLTVPGLQVENLVVKVLTDPAPATATTTTTIPTKGKKTKTKTAGPSAQDKQRDRAFSTVLVGDESGTINLVFRGHDKKPEVKRGRFILVSGAVTTYHGKLQLQCGPRPTDLQAMKHGVSMDCRHHHHHHHGQHPEHHAATTTNDVSAVIHHVGTLLLRPVPCPVWEEGAPYAIHYGVQRHGGVSGEGVLYLESTLPHMHESLPEAASRSLAQLMSRCGTRGAVGGDDHDGQDGGGEEQRLRRWQEPRHAALLAGMPTVTEFHVDEEGRRHLYHFFLAAFLDQGEEEQEEQVHGDEQGGMSSSSSSDTGSSGLSSRVDGPSGRADEEEEDGGIVWVTSGEVRALKRTEEGKYLHPIIKKAHRLVEEAIRNGILVGSAWFALRDYLIEPSPGDDANKQAHVDDLWSFLKSSSSPPESGSRRQGEPLPVTLLSGFLGSGKTTLMRHLLQNQAGWRVAILVNDMNELNLDAELIVSDSKIKIDRLEERVVSLSNGCICCTLREDLLTQVLSLAFQSDFDYLLIESSGISEPMPVAETFTFEDENGNSLSSVARLDTCVTVVDAYAFMENLTSIERLAEKARREEEQRDGRGEGQGRQLSAEEENKTVADLMAQQVEFADVIILNKADRVDYTSLSTLEALVLRLNPSARVITTSFCRVEPQNVINTGLFSMEKARQAPGWLLELRGEHVPETIEYGVTSLLYRRQRPFHPERLHALVYGEGAESEALKTLVRVKGYVWLAGREKHIVFWSLAGCLHSFDCEGDRWLAATDPCDWPEGVDMQELRIRWQPLWGDRRQEVVLIGVHMDGGAVEEALDRCLVSEEEMMDATAPWRWKKEIKDPFPKYEEPRHHHNHGEETEDDDDDDDSSDEEEEEEEEK